MTSFQLFKGLSGVDSELLIQAEQQAFQEVPAARKRPAKKIWLIAAIIALALLLVGCAVAYATILFGSPADMISGLYGENTGFDRADPTEVSDPGKIGSSWTVPGYEKKPIEETVAQELEKWVSPVGKSISTDGFKLTVDAYVYDSTTQCGFMTMLLEHDKPIPDEYLLLNNDGEIGGLSGLYLNFNQYGRCYLIPEKTTPALLAFTFYFRADMTAGTNLLVSFPEPVASRQLEAEQAREAAIPVIRERLKKELTPEQAAEKVRELGFPGGYTGEYDDYYYLAASEYETAQDDEPSPMAQELQALEAQLKQELTPGEAEHKLRSLWGDELVEETFADQMENVPIFAYNILAERAYEQNHMDEMLCVSLPDSGSLPCKTFGQGAVYVNSLCVQISHSTVPDDDLRSLVFHMTDGTDFVVADSLTDNTLFRRVIEHGDLLYMLNSAVNIDKIQSVEIICRQSDAVLDADAQ